MPKQKQYIVTSASISTAKETYTKGQLLSEEEYKALPDIFKKKAELFDESNKDHLKLSQNHESPVVQKTASAVDLEFVNARLDRIEEELKLKPLNAVDADELTEEPEADKETKKK